MKLEVGKSYKTRNGLVVIVRRHRPEELYTFVAERGSCVYTYTAEGCYLAARQTHELDIVVEDSPIVEVVQFRTPNGKLFDTREQAEAELEAARFVEDLRARGCPESVIEHLVLNYNVSKKGN